MELFGHIVASYVDKWRRFEASSRERTLSGQFEAGRIVGDVLVDVLRVIGTGVAVAKTAAKIPRLVRLAQRHGLAVRTSGAGGGAAMGEPAVTPSQLTGRGPRRRARGSAAGGNVEGSARAAAGHVVADDPVYETHGGRARGAADGVLSGCAQTVLEDLASDPEKVAALRKAGITGQELADMRNGIAPDLYDVHHKLPLDDNGTNAAENLIVMKNDPYHRALTNMQHELTKGMVPGQTRTLSWPVPDGFVYPAQ
jgi:hypothetical protein